MKPSIRSLFFSSALYYFLLSLAPNKVSLGGITVLFVLYLVRTFGSIKLALGAMYIILFPIIIGKTFVIDLITAQNLNIPGRVFGISADVTLGLGDAIIACMVLYMVLVPGEFVRSKVRNVWMELLLFLYPLGVIVSTFFGSARLDISFFHSIYAVRPLIIYYFFSSKKGLSLDTLVSLLSAGVFLEVVVVTGQMLMSGPLGISIEPITNYISVDLSREAAGLLRYSGTYMHANALGNALILPLVVIFPVLMRRFGGKPYVAPYIWMMGVATLIFTMSRSAWGGFAAACAAYLYAIRAVWGYTFRFVYPVSRTLRAVLICAGIAAGILMTPRLISTLSSGGTYGSVETRVLLMKEYVQVIASHPFFGVGLEMDVYTAYLRSFVRGEPDMDSPNRAVLQYFPEPVHNGIMRLLVQVGFVGTLPYIGVFIGAAYLSWMNVRRAKDAWSRMVALAMFCAFIGVGVNSMMQPILPDLQYLLVLTMIGAQNIS